MNSFIVTIDRTVQGYWAWWLVLGLILVFAVLYILREKKFVPVEAVAVSGFAVGMTLFIALLTFIPTSWETRDDRIHEALIAEGYDLVLPAASEQNEFTSMYTLSRDGDAAIYTVYESGDTFTFTQISE